MTPEELNRTIEFITQSQARLAAAQEQDRQDRIEFQEWSKALFARMERTEAGMEQTQARMERTQARMERTQARMEQTQARMERTDERLAHLLNRQTDLLDHQSQRMDRLDKFYEGWLEQNGNFQQQVLDFQRQALHLLNLILDRLLPAPPNPN